MVLLTKGMLVISGRADTGGAVSMVQKNNELPAVNDG